METITKIRRLYHIEGKGYKTIARLLKLSKNTVKKVIRSEKTAFHYQREMIHYPVLENHVETLKLWLEEDSQEPKRRRRTAKKLYEMLQAEGFKGCYETVNAYVNRYHQEKKDGLKQVFIPLSFSPGEAFQFDWSEEEIELSGELTRIKVAHIRLCHSRYFLLVAYPNEQLEMVLDAHDKAFAFFGGSCQQGIYDNMRTAVKHILVGKEREFNPRFLEMASHYFFEPVACTPASGWEKGQVENQVSTGRENFFTPLQRAASLEELNIKLKEACIQWAKHHAHPEWREKTVWEVYEAEKSTLIPYRKAFESYKVQTGVVSPSSCVMVDTNMYSVDCYYVNKPVEIRIYAQTIVIVHRQQEVGRHVRCFKRYQRCYDPWHYVPALERKPGALRHGAPFKDWKLPGPILELKKALEAYSDKDKQFVAILLLIQKEGLEKVTEACKEALKTGAANVPWVKQTLLSKSEHKEILYYPELCGMSDDCQSYDRFYLNQGDTYVS